jgi:hypothetical protein
MRKIQGTQSIMRVNLGYTLTILLLAGLAMWLSKNLIIYIALTSMVCLILISVWHHHKAKVLSADTLLEYLLTIVAATLVLLGAALHS